MELVMMSKFIYFLIYFYNSLSGFNRCREIVFKIKMNPEEYTELKTAKANKGKK